MKMSITRSEAREIACQVLYESYILDNAKIQYNIKDLIKEKMEVENAFINLLVNGVIEKQKEINKIANEALIDWEIDRLSKVDKAILSVGIYELLYTDTPPVVTINEAIELSHKYSDEKVSKMINAALDKIYKQREE